MKWIRVRSNMSWHRAEADLTAEGPPGFWLRLDCGDPSVHGVANPDWRDTPPVGAPVCPVCAKLERLERLE